MGVSVCAGGGGVAVSCGARTWLRVAGGRGEVRGAGPCALGPAGRAALLQPGGVCVRLDSEPGAAWRLRRPARQLRAREHCAALAALDREGGAFSLELGRPPLQLAGHLGALLAVALADRHVLTCDRDEKIRVAHYPRTRDVLCYCLGHKQFVNGLELLSHDRRCALSCSGDGTVKLWDYTEGKEIFSIDVAAKESSTDADQLSAEMKKRGLDLECLPVKKIVCTRGEGESSVLAVSLYGSRKLYTYVISGSYPKMTYKFSGEISLKAGPADMAVDEKKLWICFREGASVNLQEWTLSESGSAEYVSETTLDDLIIDADKPIREDADELSYLYKRKIDNIKEYSERKRKRLESSIG